MTKKIGILGSGVVAQTLAAGFSKEGSSVMLGTAHSEKLHDFSSSNAMVQIGTFEKAARFGDIVFLCVKGTASETVIKELPEDVLAGKTVVDTTNPIADAPPQNGVLSYFTTLSESLLERLQKINPNAHFVKAFNSVGNAFMIHPDFGGQKPTMFICGNIASAKKEVVELLEKVGWEAEDMGMAESARAIEPLCILWCIPGFLRNEWGHAFKLLKK
jgi:predicted dinucleotide-binding enzyme